MSLESSKRVASTEEAAASTQSAREDFDVSIDMGDLDGENAPATTETLRAITVRALGRATLREWSATLEQFARELDKEPTGKHPLFTCANVVRVIKQLIERKNVKIAQGPSATQLLLPQQLDSKKRAPIIAIFAISVQCELLPEIKDELALTLESVAQTDTEMAFKRLVRRVEKQDKEIARMSQIIATYGDFTRAFEVNRRVTQIVARYGTLSERMYELAQRAMTAEVDGAPMVFRVLGCDAPIWLRSIIRFANECLPESGPTHHITSGITFTLPSECIGGNEMSSRPISLSEWISTRSHDCKCEILIIMPVLRHYAKLSSHSGVMVLRELHIQCRKPCLAPVVIFGNPFIDTSDRSTYDGEINQHRAKFAPWLSQCTAVHVAQLGTSESQVASAGPAVGPIYQYNERVARAYEGAIDAQGKLDATPNQWTYPTHIVSISGNVKQ